MEDQALINTLLDTPPEAKAERLGDTYCDVQAEAVVETLAESSLGGKADI